MSVISRFPRVWWCVVGTLALGACKDSTEPPAPLKEVVASGGVDQSSVVGTTLTQELSVRVRNTKGQAVKGVTVAWAVLSGGGSVSPATSTTDDNGVATTRWMLGTTAGQQSVSASVSGLTAATFTATATAGPITQVQAQFVGSTSDFAIGDSVRIQASAIDQFGNVVAGQPVTFQSSNPAVATVSQTGFVRAVAPGTATITVAAGSLSTTLQVSVGSSSCTAANTIAMQLGETREFVGSAASRLCIGGGAAGSEYAIVATFTDRSGSLVMPLTVAGLNVVDAVGPPTPARLPLPGTAGVREPALEPDVAFEARLRTREQRELPPLLSAAREWFRARQASGGARTSRSIAAGAVPQVGDVLTLNAQANFGCSNPLNKPGRVVAVSNNAVVVADTTNPANGFTTADYEAFAADFDTLVTVVDTTNFGAPTDIDGNGRAIIFFTREVNALTPANSSSFIGGFFYQRDLFPKTATGRLGGCATSNQAEMFYMLVPDPDGTVNNNKRSTSFVKGVTTATIAHEFQHLINSSRRLYVNQVSSEAVREATWLDEGLSHIAEELTFYRAAGLTPGQNLTIQGISANPKGLAAINAFQTQNMGRFSNYLRNPEGNSPIAPNDNLATRGATWWFLRYAADRKGGDQAALWRSLVNSTTVGLPNLTAALGTDPLPWIQDWSTAIYTDDQFQNLAARYTEPSWHTRNIMAALSSNSGKFPLKVTNLTASAGAGVSVTAGSAAYLRFGVGANTAGRISTSATVQGQVQNPPSAVTFTLVRTK